MAGFLSELLTKYNLIKNNGVPVTRRTAISFIGATCTDDPSNDQTLISVSGAVVGIAQIDANTSVSELPGAFVTCTAGTTTTIATLPGNSIAFDESVAWAVLIQIKKKVGGPFGYIGRMIDVTNTSPGNITTPTGGTTDWDITANVAGSMNAALSGVTASIVVGGSTLTVQVVNPLGFDIVARLAQSSVSRALLPGTGPTPVVTARSVSSGPGSGGTNTVLTGTGFLGTTSVTLDGAAATFIPPISDTAMIVTSGGFSGSPGNGPIVVTNANGPGSDTSGGWTYTSTLATPLTILGSTHLVGWYENTDIQGSSTATGWNDETAGAQNLTAHASPTINASDSLITPAGKTVSMNGSSNYFDLTPFSLGSGGTGIFVMVVSEQTANGGWIVEYVGSVYFQLLSFGDSSPGHFHMTSTDTGGGSVVETGSSSLNVLSCAWGYNDGSAGAGNRTQVATGTNAPQTTTTTTSTNQSSPGHLFIGGTSAFMTGKLVAVLVANILPNSTQIAQLVAYYHSKYGV